MSTRAEFGKAFWDFLLGSFLGVKDFRNAAKELLGRIKSLSPASILSMLNKEDHTDLYVFKQLTASATSLSKEHGTHRPWDRANMKR